MRSRYLVKAKKRMLNADTLDSFRFKGRKVIVTEEMRELAQYVRKRQSRLLLLILGVIYIFLLVIARKNIGLELKLLIAVPTIGTLWYLYRWMARRILDKYIPDQIVDHF